MKPWSSPASDAAWEAELQAMAGDEALRDEGGFIGRSEALDRLESRLQDGIAARMGRAGASEAGDPRTDAAAERRAALDARARALMDRLEAVNAGLFRRLRKEIRDGGLRGKALRDRVESYCGGPASSARIAEGPGYDALDEFVDGLLLPGEMPSEILPLEPGMVFYQKTPARIVFALAEGAGFTAEDVCYDLGSGLGLVPILTHLLSGVRARGVEVEPAFCRFARARAVELGLAPGPETRGVDFLDADARSADLSDGTVFFLYTPFTGSMLQAVLERLRGLARAKVIRIFTYGPCTAEVARLAWLGRLEPRRQEMPGREGPMDGSTGPGEWDLGMFISRPEGAA